MGNTNSGIYIHLIMVVKFQKSQIESSWQEELYQYITGVIRNQGNRLFAIGGMHDHLHIFIDLNPSIPISEFVRHIKSCSTKWINKKTKNGSKFQWQAGYAAFSYAKSQRDVVTNYIHRQEEHHAEKSFNHEFRQFLERFDIEYEEKYLFSEPV